MKLNNNNDVSPEVFSTGASFNPVMTILYVVPPLLMLGVSVSNFASGNGFAGYYLLALGLIVISADLLLIPVRFEIHRRNPGDALATLTIYSTITHFHYPRITQAILCTSCFDSKKVCFYKFVTDCGKMVILERKGLHVVICPNDREGMATAVNQINSSSSSADSNQDDDNDMV